MSEVNAPAPEAAQTPTQAAEKEVLNTLPNKNPQPSAKSSAKSAMEEAESLIMGESDEELEDEELEDDVEEEEEKPKKEAKKSWRLKVGGEEIEVKDENELIKRAQMGYSAEQKWQEAAQLKKEIEGFVKVLQENPGYALQQMGFDVDELAKNHLEARIKEMEKSPEQVEREKLQKELDDLRKEKEKEREESRKREIQQLQDKYAVEVETQISEALDSMKTLPKSPYTVKRIADAMILAFQSGKHDVTAKDVLPIVEKQIKSELQDMFGVMPEELIEAVVGKENFNRVRKKRVSRAKKPEVKKVEATGESEIKAIEAEKNAKPRDKVAAKDFFKNLGSF